MHVGPRGHRHQRHQEDRGSDRRHADQCFRPRTSYVPRSTNTVEPNQRGYASRPCPRHGTRTPLASPEQPMPPMRPRLGPHIRARRQTAVHRPLLRRMLSLSLREAVRSREVPTVRRPPQQPVHQSQTAERNRTGTPSCLPGPYQRAVHLPRHRISTSAPTTKWHGPMVADHTRIRWTPLAFINVSAMRRTRT